MRQFEAIEYRGYRIVKESIEIIPGEPLPRTPSDLIRFTIVEIAEGKKWRTNYAPSEEAARAKIDDMIVRRARVARPARRQTAPA